MGDVIEVYKIRKAVNKINAELSFYESCNTRTMVQILDRREYIF